MARIVKKPEERRSDIIKAARYLFQSRGYEKVNMQELMDYLGIAKGTIYHYFKSKESLFEAVVEEIVDANIKQMESFIQDAKGDALEKLQKLIELGSLKKEDETILKSLHSPTNGALHLRLLVATLLKQAPLYGKLIEQGCKEGLFRTSAPLECAEFILSGLQFLTDLGIYPWTQEDLNRRFLAFPQLIEQQLQAQPGSFHFMFRHYIGEK